MPDEYISREAMLEHLDRCKQSEDATTLTDAVITALQCFVQSQPTADVTSVVRCKDCKYSTLPSELTQRYGKPGTLTCHNKYSPCNRRNVSENDFCSYGEAE